MDGETLSDYVRSACDRLAEQRRAADPDELAVERVCRMLSDRGHEILARAVAVATDPEPPTDAEIAEIAVAVRRMLRREGRTT